MLVNVIVNHLITCHLLASFPSLAHFCIYHLPRLTSHVNSDAYLLILESACEGISLAPKEKTGKTFVVDSKVFWVKFAHCN